MQENLRVMMHAPLASTLRKCISALVAWPLHKLGSNKIGRTQTRALSSMYVIDPPIRRLRCSGRAAGDRRQDRQGPPVSANYGAFSGIDFANERSGRLARRWQRPDYLPGPTIPSLSAVACQECVRGMIPLRSALGLGCVKTRRRQSAVE
jgi:hypothetical protein